MARGPTKQANAAVNNENRVAGNLEGRSNTLFDTLEPQLTSEATNPQGYGAKDLAATNTAAQQSIGGSTAGAVGSGNVMAARTRNRGGFSAAADEAARSGQRELSQRATEIQGQNAQLKENQRQAGLSGLQGLYGTNLSGSLAAMGLVPGTINAETNAGKSGWFQNFLGLLSALNPGYSKGGGVTVG